MLEELRLRSLSEATIRAYLGAVGHSAQYFGKSPEQLGPEQVRQYLLHLINDKKDTCNTIQVYRLRRLRCSKPSCQLSLR
jgi:integrase/recombinase XerD